MLGKVRKKRVSWKVLWWKGSNSLSMRQGNPACDGKFSAHRKVKKDDNGPGASGIKCQATERQWWREHLRLGTWSRQKHWLPVMGKGNLRCTPPTQRLWWDILFQAKKFPNFLIVWVCSPCEGLQPFQKPVLCVNLIICHNKSLYFAICTHIQWWSNLASFWGEGYPVATRSMGWLHSAWKEAFLLSLLSLSRSSYMSVKGSPQGNIIVFDHMQALSQWLIWIKNLELLVLVPCLLPCGIRNHFYKYIGPSVLPAIHFKYMFQKRNSNTL